MVTQEAPELPSSHKLTKCTAACGTVPSERDPEAS